MTLYRIYAEMIASRRYQVVAIYDETNYYLAAKKYGLSTDAKTMGYPTPELTILSPRPYPKGCIVNPSKIIHELIAARKEV